jgi:DNA polymerase-3 subunit epsilon
MSAGIVNRNILETPVAIIDFETTGLTPGCDRVVEVSVVRVEPGSEPRLVFDTLVNPSRPMAATEVHGITDEDVKNAPRFQDVAGEVVAATKDCVIAAYNVYFDIKFLIFELSNAGVAHQPPHFCLMYLRPMLGLGGRCKLEEACRHHGVDYSPSHVAARDAMASGQLYRNYLTEIQRRKIHTYGELAKLKRYKFNESFHYSPFPDPTLFGLSRFEQIVSRALTPSKEDPTRQALAAYWDTLKTVLADLEVTDDELAQAIAERERLGLSPEQVRLMHAKAFSSVMSQFASDQWIDDSEVRKLRRLHQCLERLGWAPGH